MNKINEVLFNILKNQEMIMNNQKELLRGIKGGKCISIDIVKSNFWEDKSDSKESESCEVVEEDRKCFNCGHAESWHFDSRYKGHGCNIPKPKCDCKEFALEEKSE